MKRCHYCGSQQQDLVHEQRRGVDVLACADVEPCLASPDYAAPQFDSLDPERRALEQYADDLFALGEASL